MSKLISSLMLATVLLSAQVASAANYVVTNANTTRSFSETANFTLSGVLRAQNGITGINILSSSGSLVASLTKTSNGLGSFFTLNPTSFVAGNYTINVLGTGTFQGTFSTKAGIISGTTPVPEPETTGMIALGLGVLGLIVRRKKQ